jgi:hypothetical protein
MFQHLFLALHRLQLQQDVFLLFDGQLQIALFFFAALSSLNVFASLIGLIYRI